MSVAARIKSATDFILSSTEPSDWEKASNNLYDIFSAGAGVFADNLANESYSEAKSGKFVSQTMAAHCVKDVMRTCRFIRGLHQAIEDQLAKNGSVHILYAGCGPFAALFTPMTSQFSAEQVKVTLMEISKLPLEKVEKMYTHMGLTDYVQAYINGDGTDPEIQFDDQYDIIISETMQAGLKKECQVPLTRNLVRFLADGGTFIPQNIKVEATMEGPKTQDQPNEMLIGSVYELDYLKVPAKNHQTELDIPSGEYEFMKMRTSVQTYKDEWLGFNESGVTTSLILDRFQESRNKAKFTYQEEPAVGEEIGFEWEYVD